MNESLTYKEFNKRIIEDVDFRLDVIKYYCEKELEIAHKDAFKAMNIALDKALPAGQSVDRYIRLAMLISQRLGIYAGWNNATREQLKARSTLETKILGLLESGLVDNEEKLNSAIVALTS